MQRVRCAIKPDIGWDDFFRCGGIKPLKIGGLVDVTAFGVTLNEFGLVGHYLVSFVQWG